MVYLDDGEMAVLTPDGFHTTTIDNERGRRRRSHEVDWDLDEIEKGGFEHFMLKEIFEQPRLDPERDPRPADRATRAPPSSAAST